MIPLSLAWTLLTASLWTSGSSQILMHESTNLLYPKISDTVTIECVCTNISCDMVYWFRSDLRNGEVKFIGQCNNADRDKYGDGVDDKRYKMRRNSGMSFTLRISSVTVEDTGIYSCILKDKKNKEIWRPGFLLLPGVPSPTVPPKTEPKSVNSDCRCSTKDPTQDGCGSLVLWPLVGIITTLALTLICMLYYFSRLPKKCQHHFVKKR